MSINKYSTKSGTRYAVRLYVSKDENGKQNYYVKKGFKTEKEPKLHEARKRLRLKILASKSPLMTHLSRSMIIGFQLIKIESKKPPFSIQRTFLGFIYCRN